MQTKKTPAETLSIFRRWQLSNLSDEERNAMGLSLALAKAIEIIEEVAPDHPDLPRIKAAADRL